MPYTDNSRYTSKQMWRMETFFYFVNLISTAYLTWSKDVSSQWVKYNVPGVINSGHDFINECFQTLKACALVSRPQWSDWTGRVLSDGSWVWKVNICVREESSGPCSELPVICLHSCGISKVMWVWANTPAERHAGSIAYSCPPTLGDISCICQLKYTWKNFWQFKDNIWVF